VERLLGYLTAGPTDGARAAGRSTALPPESRLSLVGLTAGTAEVEVDPETGISADRLPVAIGQVVLTVTSAPGVSAVALVSDGAPVQVPLPGGALTGEPVTAQDYASLLPDRYRGQELGCPQP
jgi:spore germination protein GerM